MLDRGLNLHTPTRCSAQGVIIRQLFAEGNSLHEGSGAANPAQEVASEQADPEALFGDERRLTRDEAVGYCLATGRTVMEIGSLALPDEVWDPGFGMARLYPSTSLILPQVRQGYDANHILGIGSKIHDGTQLQNCGLALFGTEEELRAYLAEASDFHGQDLYRRYKMTLQVCQALGGFAVTVFGHNRQLGVGLINRRLYGHPDLGKMVIFKVFENPTFQQALGMQAEENNGSPPPLYDLAWAIHAFVECGKKRGQVVNLAQVAKVFGRSIEQVSEALKFENLPEAIKQLVVDEKLPYTGAVALGRLGSPYYKPEAVVEFAQDLAGQNASAQQIIEFVNARMLALRLPAEAAGLLRGGQISLAAGKEICRLVEAGFIEADIDEVVKWVVTDKPTWQEIRAKVTWRIEERRLNGSSLWEGSQDMVVAERAAQSRDNQRHHIQTAVRQIRQTVGALTAMLKSGSMADVVEDRPIADAVRHDLLLALETLGGLLPEIILAGDSAEVLTTLGELARLIKNESGENYYSQIERHLAVLSKHLEAQEADRNGQQTLV